MFVLLHKVFSDSSITKIDTVTAVNCSKSLSVIEQKKQLLEEEWDQHRNNKKTFAEGKGFYTGKLIIGQCKEI
jgi:hypothetical protein